MHTHTHTFTTTQLASFFQQQQQQQQQQSKQPLPTTGRDDGAAGGPYNLLDGFLVFLLPVLLHCGLLESLTVRSLAFARLAPRPSSTGTHPPIHSHVHFLPLPTTTLTQQAFAIGSHEDPSKGRAATLLVDTVRALPHILPEPRWLSLVAMPALVRICEAAQAAGAAAAGRGRAATDAHLLADRGADLMRRLCRAGLPLPPTAALPPGGAAAAAVAAAASANPAAGIGGRRLSSPACPLPGGAKGAESLAGTFPGLSDPGACVYVRVCHQRWDSVMAGCRQDMKRGSRH
jgi:hypothetical protein